MMNVALIRDYTGGPKELCIPNDLSINRFTIAALVEDL